MDIDDFLEREIKGGQLIGKKSDDDFKNLDLGHQDIVEEVKKYYKRDDIFEKIKIELQKNNFESANKLYYDLWLELSQKIEWNQKLYDNLVKSGFEIKDALSRLSPGLLKKKQTADNIFKRANDNIINGNYQAALSQYSELA